MLAGVDEDLLAPLAQVPGDRRRLDELWAVPDHGDDPHRAESARSTAPKAGADRRYAASVSATDPTRVGVVGLGYWGPNLARNFEAIEDAELGWCCDRDPASRERWSGSFPSARFTAELDEMLADDDLDAVVITTSVSSHAELAERALEAGKHCLVEKPLARDAAAAERLATLAERRGLTLMAGHLLEYHPGIERLRELVRDDELGAIRYLASRRLNLGKVRSDENALWSLGAHDVSVLLTLVDEAPIEAWAHGAAFLSDGIEDVVFAFLRYPSGVVAHLHLSWLDPHKERRLTVVGSRRMATFDEMALERKLTVFDRGFDRSFESYGEYITRSGAAWSPAVSNREPLRIECEHFLHCVRTGERPRSDGESGIRVVRVLEALEGSLRSGGSAVEVAAGAGARSG
jgi:predicted dehydrogenase